MLAEIITIGDEILIGQIVDANSAWMAVELNKVGIQVKQITTVADHRADIIVALTLASGRADLVLVTGGLGPTKDDVTKQALCTFFECGLRRDPQVLAHVEAIFSRSKRPMLDVNREQADVLDKADVLFNAVGTAPGMWLAHKNKQYVFMPGVPAEMKHLMEHAVLPRLLFFEDRQPLWHQTLLTAGIGESFLAEKIADIEHSLPPNIHLAYLPKAGSVRLRLTAMGKELEILQQKTAYYASQIKEAIGPHFIADGDVTLEEVVIAALKHRGATLGTAESCTGGNISRLLTTVPGCSEVFMGGGVTYSNASKAILLDVQQQTLDQFGAVSEQTVQEMAEGIKKVLNCDFAVAVSGVAGPGGGTPDKPVGHVWIAVAGPGHTQSKLYQFGSDRLINIERASAAALYELFVLMSETSE